MGGFKYLKRTYDRLPTEIIWANDIDPYACKVYESNLKHPILERDVREIIQEDNFPKGVDIVLGGFPCQDFSVSGKRRGFQSPRGLLYRSMVEFVKKVRPQVFIAENVKGLLSIPNAVDTIKRDFAESGYHGVSVNLAVATSYGVPQSRERVFIIGWRNKKKAAKFKFPVGNEQVVTSLQAIGDIEDEQENALDSHVWSKAKRTNGQGQSRIKADAPSYTIRAEHHGNIEYHYKLDRRLSVREAARLQTFPDEFEFGSVATTYAYRVVGNAVPPVLAWHIAKAIRETLQ